MPLMKWAKENFYLKPEYLSNIELYYATELNNNHVVLTGDEYKHITKVMRHSVGDILHVTDGKGNYFETKISDITKSNVVASIKSTKKYSNKFENIYFCFPRLKSSSRFEFELEKSIELGITNFIIFHSDRTIPKGEKLERWNKIALAAMKQSLRTYLPKIEYVNSLKQLSLYNGRKIIFDQKSEIALESYVSHNELKEEDNLLIFGPEGGLSEKELLSIENAKIIRLTQNRLRAETAVVTAASVLSVLGER